MVKPQAGEAGGESIAAMQTEDIVGLRRAQETLAAERALFRSAFEDAPVGMAISGPAPGQVEANRALAEMLGYTPEELRLVSPRDNVVPGSPPDAADLLRAIDASQTGVVSVDREVLRKDGGRVTVRVSASAVRDEAGRIARIVSHVEDVSELARAERARAASEGLFRAGFEGAAIGMAIANAQGLFVDVNPALCAMLGQRREDLLGRSFRDITPEEDLEAELPLVRRLVDGEADSYQMEKRYQRADGTLFWARLSVGAVRGPDGAVLWFIGQIEDISETRAAQEALAASERELRVTFEDAAIGMALCTASGHFMKVNAALAAMLGYEPEELLRLGFRETTHPDDVAASDRQFRAVVAGEIDHFRQEKRCLRKDGATVWARLNVRSVRGPTGEFLFNIGQIEDVSDIREAQAALAASEEQLRSTFENSALGILVADPSGRYRDANPAICTMLGYTREELTARSFRDITHPDDVALSVALRERLDAGGTQETHFEKRFVRKDGGVVWARLHYRRAYAADGTFLRSVVQVEDITAFHGAQQALAVSREQLRSAFEDAAISMMIAHVDRYVDVNPALCAMLGYERHELIGLGYADITHPDDLAQTRERVSRVLSGETDRYVEEKRYLRKDGSVLWARVHIRRVFDTAGAYLRTVGQIEDISDIHAAQEALAASEARFRAIVRDSTDITVVCAPDMTARWISPAVTTLLGHDPSLFIGQQALDTFVHPDDRSGIREMVARAMSERAPGRAAARTRHADGSWRSLEGVFDGGADHEAVGGLVFHLRDVTERKEAEQAVERALELEQAATARMQEVARQRSDFLAMVAHDFRTPLTAIQGYAELLGLGVGGADETREFAATIGESARRLNRMVESLRHLDDLKGDLPPLALTPADPSVIVEAAVRQASTAWPERALELDIDPGLPQVLADVDLVTRAVGNLVDNAFKYSPDGDEVAVRVMAAADGFRVSVMDHGIGIPANDLARVFEKFARSGNASAQAIEGTGLGLLIVRAIARAHGGEAWAESEPGEGTTVHLVIRNATPPPPRISLGLIAGKACRRHAPADARSGG